MAVRLGPLTPEEYDRWLKPEAALARLPDAWHDATKRNWLGSRIKDGLIATACGDAKSTRGDARRGIRQLDTAAWVSWHPDDSGFWHTGDFEMHRPGVSGYGDSELLGRIYNVRLDPYEIDKAFPRETGDVPRPGFTIAPEKYETMVPAHEAYSKLATHFNDTAAARAALIRRLSNSVLLSVAQMAVVRDGDGAAWTPFPIIRSDHWDKIATGKDSHLWITSEVDVDLRTQGRHGELEDEHSISYLGIRFDRGGLNLIAPLFKIDDEPASASDSGGAREPPKRKQDRPSLPQPIAQAWYDWLKSVTPNLTQTAAEASAKVMFPNHNLSRERIREFVDDSPVGKPRKSKP